MVNEIISLRPMRDIQDDYIAMQSWFHDPAITQWVWCDEKGEPPVSLERVIEKYRPRILAKTDVFPYFITRNGTPIGFIQYYINDEASIGLDMWIGNEDSRGKGRGTEALMMMVELIHRRYPQAKEIFITPDAQNARAIRCYRKAGFLPIGNVIDDGVDSLLMKVFF